MRAPAEPSAPPIRGAVRRRTAVAIALASTLTAILGGCSTAESTAKNGPANAERVALAGPERTVRVGVLRSPHVAHTLFYEPYLPANVTLDVIAFANATEIKNAVVSGDLELAVTGITAAMQGAANGEPVVVVAAAADGGSAIVAGADSGIAGVADLKGRKIGFVPGSAQDILLRLTLTQAGINPESDVKLVNVQFADMAAALARGDIDAFSSAEVGPSDALVAGAKLVTYPYDTPMGKINIALVTSTAMITRDRDLVQAMVEVHSRATEYMGGHTTEWADEVENAYGFAPASLKLALPNIELRWRMDKAYADQVAVLGRQQAALGQIKGEPDYAAFIDMQFVQRLG